MTTAYLTDCAKHEGGRAILAIQSNSNLETVYYFAREAAHYARLLLACKRCGDQKPIGQSCGCFDNDCQ